MHTLDLVLNLRSEPNLKLVLCQMQYNINKIRRLAECCHSPKNKHHFFLNIRVHYLKKMQKKSKPSKKSGKHLK